jgi:hypothetical protein
MFNSFAMMRAGSQPARNAIQFLSCGNVPGTTRISRVQFSAASRALEPIEGESVCYRGTEHGDKMSASIRFPARLIPETFR